MIDRDGYLHVARGDSRDPSSLEVDPSFKVYLGPGRPLGFHLDTDDNLLTCSLLVGLRGRGGGEIPGRRLPALPVGVHSHGVTIQLVEPAAPGPLALHPVHRPTPPRPPNQTPSTHRV